MEEFSDLGNRFSKYLEYKGLGINKTAKIFGFSGSQISNIVNGKVFGTDKMFNILNVFKDLDANFLFRGGTEMIINNKTIIDEPNPIRDKLIERQDQLIAARDEKIAALEKEISELKKAQENPSGYGMVAESKPKLTSDTAFEKAKEKK